MSDPALYYAVGTSIANMVTFDLLGIIAPFQDAYVPFTVETPAHDALVYGHGFEATVLRWGFISQAQRNTLKSYCPGKSATVYVRVRDDDWQWVYVKANMIWQEEQPPDNGFILDFSVVLIVTENYGSSPP